MTPVRFGFIGAGRVARDFAQGLGEVPDAALSAVWSRSETTAHEFVARFPGTRVANHPDELVAADDVDVVYVATPHHRHAPDSLLALRNGKPVLCEKPFALSHAEASAVVEEARKGGLFCMEAMWMRCIPAIRRAKELIDQGVIGDPRMMTADFGAATTYDPSSRFYDPAQGGGALLDRGVYAISLAHLFFGTPDSAVGLSSQTPSGVDEQIGAVLRFPEGRLGVLAASLGSTTPSAAVIAGTTGRLHLEAPFFCSSRLSIVPTPISEWTDLDEPSLRTRASAALKRSRLGSELVHRAKTVLRPPEVVRLPLSGNGYSYEASEVVRCLRMGVTESSLMPLDESLAVMKTLDRLHQAGG